MADAFTEKRKAGLVQAHGSGYGGTGFKFDKTEEGAVVAARKAKAKASGGEVVCVAWGVVACVWVCGVVGGWR